ncbi:MAG TPA: FecR domain-containing protein [Croceibacterium sp.]|nr:FecR domain-containing protein [Croceibacterium sp.]
MANELVREQAIAWAVRTGDPAFDGWEDFTLWLEESPANAAAYDAALLAVAEAAEVLPPVPKADNDDAVPAGGATRRRWLGGAVAASVAVVAALGAWQFTMGTYTVETAPGETLLIALSGGGEIALAGNSSIELDRRDTRVASLQRGQALFTIRHDDNAPFRLTVGDDEVIDVGTIFDVRRGPGGMTVAVSEGEVIYNPRRENVHLVPGQVLKQVEGGAGYRVATIPLDQVGEWRNGRVTFQDAALGDVADDLARATGIAFVAGRREADQRISGSVLVDPVKKDPRTVGPLLGVTVRYTGEAWEIGAR